jgi:urea transport system permease protein
MIINSRFFNRSELIGFVALALLLFVILPLSLDVFRLNLVAKYLTYAFVAIGLEPRAGGVLRPRRLLHGDVPQA